MNRPRGVALIPVAQHQGTQAGRSRMHSVSERMVEEFVHLDGTARFDLHQERRASAYEASDRPALWRDAPMSAAFL